MSGGISAHASGGSFWAGVRQGVITSALNHVAQMGASPDKLPDGRFLWDLSDAEFLLFANAETRHLVTGCECDVQLTVAERLYLVGRALSLVNPTTRLNGIRVFSAAKGGVQLSKAKLKSISSLESQIAKHESKLAEYIKDPMKFDNKKF